jgi:hypothetical protein
MNGMFLYRFRYLGPHNDWFAVRAPTWNTEFRGPMGALFFENQVFEWLFENAKGNYHLANGNAAGYPDVPALANGSSLCVLFERMSDLMNFSTKFPVRHLDQKNI